MTIAEGFPGQRLLVLPRPLVDEALRAAVTARLLVTDCGFFPHAEAHGMRRGRGIDQAILIFCTRGGGWVESSGSRRPVSAGQVVVIPPGTAHAYGAEPDDPWTVWWLHVTGTDVPAFLEAMGVPNETQVRNVSDRYRAVALVEEVVRWMERDLTRSSLIAATGAAWHLLALLSADRPTSNRRSTVIEEAQDYLRNHLEERVSVANLASMASMSPSHFAFLFREQVGYPVVKYQTHLRMARGRELLDTSDEPISTVARLVGYDDAFYFSRQFRALHGTTPLKYRRQRKG